MHQKLPPYTREYNVLTNPLLASRRLNHIIVASLDIDREITDPPQHNLGIEENTKESFDHFYSKSTSLLQGQQITSTKKPIR